MKSLTKKRRRHQSGASVANWTSLRVLITCHSYLNLYKSTKPKSLQLKTKLKGLKYIILSTSLFMNLKVEIKTMSSFAHTQILTWV